MANYIKIVTEGGDQYLEALASTQDQFLNYMKAVAAWTPAVTPKLAVFDHRSLPSTSEVFEVNFAFAEKLLKQQQAFTERWLAVRTPA